MKAKIAYPFTGTLWKHQGAAAWHFISLPKSLSQEIRYLFKSEEQGWGRLQAVIRINSTQWEGAIWFDKKQDTYLLPVRADVRKLESLTVGDEIFVQLFI